MEPTVTGTPAPVLSAKRFRGTSHSGAVTGQHPGRAHAQRAVMLGGGMTRDDSITRGVARTACAGPDAGLRRPAGAVLPAAELALRGRAEILAGAALAAATVAAGAFAAGTLAAGAV
jgi:hypothetical protein